MVLYEFQIIETSEKETWERVLNSFDATYYHSWKYCSELAKSQEKGVSLLVATDSLSKKTVAISTFSIRLFNKDTIDAYTPYGYGGLIVSKINKQEFENELLAFLKTKGFTTYYIQQHPLYDDLELFKIYRKTINDVFIWDIARDNKELWSGLSKGHKYEIKKVDKRNDFVISEDVPSTFERFYDLYNKNLQRVDASDVYFFSKNFLYELSNDSKTIYLASKINGQVEAVTLFLNNGDISEYFISAASSEGINHTRKLIWQTVSKLKDMNFNSVNLGGGVQKRDFLAQFKSRFGAKESSLQVIQLVVNIENYKKQMCGRNYSDIKYFPAYWKN